MEVASNQRFNDKQDGRHVGTRTPDLYRVNLEVRTLKPVSHLAFPHFSALENAPKQLGFDGELMASFLPPRVLKRSVTGGDIGFCRQYRGFSRTSSRASRRPGLGRWGCGPRV